MTHVYSNIFDDIPYNTNTKEGGKKIEVKCSFQGLIFSRKEILVGMIIDSNEDRY
jgi:hypothetical protein